MGVPGSGGNFICVGRSRMDATATSAAVDETFATTSAAASLANVVATGPSFQSVAVMP